MALTVTTGPATTAGAAGAGAATAAGLALRTFATTGFRLCVFAAIVVFAGVGAIVGATNDAEEPIIRPAATCVRGCASFTGITGTSIAGFSIRAALTTRLARLDLFALAGAAGAGASIAGSFVVLTGGVVRLGSTLCPASVGRGAAVTKLVAALLASALAAPRFLRLRLLRELVNGAAASGVVGATDAAPADDSSFASRGALAALTTSGAAANSSTRGIRPDSLRRPPRCTGIVLVMTDDSGRSDGVAWGSFPIPDATASPVAVIGALVSVSDGSSPAASRRAFLRAVRLAPPRERRFFGFAESSPSTAASRLAVADTVVELTTGSLRSESATPTRVAGLMMSSAAGCSLSRVAAFWNCSFSVGVSRCPLPRPSRRPRSGRPERAPRWARNSSGDRRGGRPSVEPVEAASSCAASVTVAVAVPSPISIRSSLSSGNTVGSGCRGIGKAASCVRTWFSSAATSTLRRLSCSSFSRVVSRNSRCSGAPACSGRWPNDWRTAAHSLRKRPKSASKYVRANLSQI